MRSRTSSASRHTTDREHDLRARIAAEAARLISESGLRDYQSAKRKAAERLGVGADVALPKNQEIEDALRTHQRLFLAEEQPRRLRDLRETAHEAMRFFADFEPRLVGAVLEGTADRHSAVCLHLFSDDPDAPARLLDERGIPYEAQTRRMRITRATHVEFPAMLFSADGTTIDVTVFPHDHLRQAPLDRIDNLPMRRAALTALEQLLADESD